MKNKVYPSINNGVYRCGFATTQAAYDEAASSLHSGLLRADALLAERRFLAGDKFTEADLRLFPTVVRFDAAYSGIFRCGRLSVRGGELPHLEAWMRDVWQVKVPGSPLQVCVCVCVHGWFGHCCCSGFLLWRRIFVAQLTEPQHTHTHTQHNAKRYPTPSTSTRPVDPTTPTSFR